MADLRDDTIGGEATVLLKVTDTYVEVVNLGASVCATASGIPPEVAAHLAPDPRWPMGDCPEPAPDTSAQHRRRLSRYATR